MIHRQAMLEGSQFAQRMQDSDRVSKWAARALDIENTLNSHWNGQYITEATNRAGRDIDSAVIHAFVSFNNGKYSLTG
jgi:hypothetical protein